MGWMSEAVMDPERSQAFREVDAVQNAAEKHVKAAQRGEDGQGVSKEQVQSGGLVWGEGDPAGSVLHDMGSWRRSDTWKSHPD